MDDSVMTRLQLGVVVERRKSRHRWLDYSWRPVAVIPGARDADPLAEWSVLRQDEGGEVILFHAGTLPMELYRKEAEGYKYNLSQKPPKVFVVMRSGSDMNSRHPFVPFFITACPYEASQYMVSGDEIVEAVEMPPPVAALVKAFVDRHYEPEPFYKRKRAPHDPRKGQIGAKVRGRHG